MNAPSDNVDFPHGWLLSLILLLLLIIFGPVLLGYFQFGYRDSATLYQPLFEWTRDRWWRGELPLWCAQDNWGTAVVADMASSVFYPGKLVFLTPWVPFSVLFGIYVVLHVLLAVGTAYGCGRTLGLTPASAWLTAVAYGLGGSVMSQTSNVIFLVSAAWLPLAIGLIFRFAMAGRIRLLAALAVIMALMVLGGDPQMAMHVLLIAGLVWCPWCKVGLAATSCGGVATTRWIGWLAALSFVALLAAACAAIQLLPGAQWSQSSERATDIADRSVYRSWTPRIPATATGEPVNRLARPQTGTHPDAIYQFSQAPWSMLELVWPNLYGQRVPWSDRLAGADRVWSGSIYLGILVLLLAITYLSTTPLSSQDGVLLLLLIGFLLASFGWYGLGWLIHELNLMRGGSGTNHVWGEPTGGMYWFLEMLVPGYYRFRYPAKLFVVAALLIGLLGGKGLDQWRGQPQTQRFPTQFHSRLRGAGGWVIVASMGIACAIGFNQAMGYRAFPIIDALATMQISQALFHTTLVIGLLLLIMAARLRFPQFARHLPTCVVALTAVELALAVAWTAELIPVPAREPVEFPTTAFQTTAYRDPGLDAVYDRRDLTTQAARDRQSLYPKYHLQSTKRLVGSFSSLQPVDIAVLLANPEWVSLLPLMSVDERIEQAAQDSPQPFIHEISGRPRFYFADSWQTLAPIDQRSASQVAARTAEVIALLNLGPASATSETDIQQQGDPIGQDSRVTHHAVVVEATPQQMEGLVGAAAARTVSCLEHRHEYQRFQIQASSSGLLVIADYFADDWQAGRVHNGQWESFPRVRVNRVLTGVVVPAGKYELVVRYRPRWFWVGMGISLLAWVCLAIGWVGHLPKRCRG